MTNTPPFIAGQQAFKAGQPCTPPEMPEGDIYPGARKMWVDGWNVAKNQAEHSEQMKRRLAVLELMADGRPRTKDEIFARTGELSREQFRKMIVNGAIQSQRVSVGEGQREWIYSAPTAQSEAA